MAKAPRFFWRHLKSKPCSVKEILNWEGHDFGIGPEAARLDVVVINNFWSGIKVVRHKGRRLVWKASLLHSLARTSGTCLTSTSDISRDAQHHDDDDSDTQICLCCM